MKKKKISERERRRRALQSNIATTPPIPKPKPVREPTQIFVGGRTVHPPNSTEPYSGDWMDFTGTLQFDLMRDTLKDIFR